MTQPRTQVLLASALGLLLAACSTGPAPAADTLSTQALPGNAKACFYEHGDFQGRSFCASGDTAAIDPAYNDLISSVRVDGATVTLYEHGNFTGRSATLTGDAAAIPEDLNDLTSSFRISQGGVTNPNPNSRNPFVDGYYADPDVAIYGGQYWVFPTTSKVYAQQTYLDAFSSPDLINWTKHRNVLTTRDISWAEYAVWAPAPIERNGKYYLYFAANDIQSNSQLGGIGVAVADQPQGPYQDAIGRPLIGEFHNGAQPIDQDVWIDDDGQAYMYYGGHRHANVAKLNKDMTSFGTFSDGSTFKEITPQGYVEGSQMFKRNGVYYLMWSEGGWTGPDYAVAYAMSDSPTGPFDRLDKILAQDPNVARGAGHNSVINVPGTDVWYILYHRRPLDQTDGNSRVLALDRMYFNSDGTIRRVVLDGPDDTLSNN